MDKNLLLKLYAENKKAEKALWEVKKTLEDELGKVCSWKDFIYMDKFLAIKMCKAQENLSLRNAKNKVEMYMEFGF